MTLLDYFAEELSEHGNVSRAASILGLTRQEGQILFDAICIQLGPQAFDRTVHPTIGEIQAVTADQFAIPVEEMTSQRRYRNITRPRQVAMYLASKRTPHSLPTIGRFFGNRDHSTVHHAIHQVETLILVDPAFAEQVRQCGERL